MSPAAVDLPPMPSGLLGFDSLVSRLSHLRGVRWRVNLCNLRPCSVDDLRRVTADYRRRYAVLRRRLLIDSYISRDRSSSPDLAVDNPLSENPDSMWGRFFRNVELEKMLDQDLSRLYPEHGSYFQTPGCQCMLRRILLLWCLRHPEYGYRQGMHELLAPLLYALHADLQRLSEARKLYEDHFTDKFDGAISQENNLTYNFDFRKIPDFIEYDPSCQEKAKKFASLDELEPEIQTIVMLSDAYGAEGELGVVLSEKFMEHDVYCMFDALMSGVGGAVAMAEFFTPSTGVGSQIGIAPVIEASSTIYHLLSVVDPSLYTHLVELGVEPQYFALRWLRVLFGREFSLENLLIIWDGIFSLDNASLGIDTEDELGPSSMVLNSRRGAFISAMAVSMMLHLRSSLLATEIATSCLQRLLNFPGSVDLEKLIEKARSLLDIALDANASPPYAVSGCYKQRKPLFKRGNSLSSESGSTEALLISVPERYWEEKWSDLNKEEELKKKDTSKPPGPKRGWTQKIKMRLPWTESEPSLSPSKRDSRKEHKSVRRSLLHDLARQLGEEIDDVGEDQSNQNGDVHDESVARVQDVRENLGESEKTSSRQSTTSEENSPFFSDPETPTSGSTSLENDTEESSAASSASHDMNDNSSHIDPVHSDLDSSLANASDSPHLSQMGPRDKKSLSGRFQWLWKLVRHASSEGPLDKGNVDAIRSENEDAQSSPMTPQPARESNYSSVSGRGDAAERNPSCTLRNLGHSMLENIQVIETVLQQQQEKRGWNGGVVEKGEERAMCALKELRKMSSILREM